MSDTTIRGNATRREPDAKRFAFFMPEPPRQLLKIFTCYLWGTHASRTKRATELPPSILPACSSPRPPFVRKPLLFRLFSFNCLPFSVSPFPAERRIPVAIPTLNSFIRSRRATAPGPAGNVSRILQNVSRLSYCFRFLPTDETTNPRMD